MSASTAPSTSTASEYDVERELLTGEAVALQLRPTSVALRAVGALIDYVAYLTATGLLLSLMLETAPALGVPDNLFTALAITIAVFGLVLVPAIVETATQGKSLGRWALGDR